MRQWPETWRVAAATPLPRPELGEHHGAAVSFQNAEFQPALLMSLGVGPTKQWNQHTLVHGGQEINVY